MKLIEPILLVTSLMVAMITARVITHALGLPPSIGSLLSVFFVGFALLMFVAIRTQMQSDQRQD